MRGLNYIKILHIINRLGAGGAQKLVADMAPLIKEKNIVIDVLMLTDENNVFEEELIKNSINVKTIPLRNIYSPLNILLIRKYLKKHQYDIVHAHLFPSNYWVSLASKLMIKNKPKLITTEHSTHNRRREKGYFKYIDRFIYSSYDKVISISTKTQERLMSWLSYNSTRTNKFIVIQNGIKVSNFKDINPYLKSELNINFTQQTQLICMVGRFSEQKDQKTLIKAIKLLPENVHLLLIGEGKLKEENEKYSKELALDDRIHFLGFRSDVNRILKTVDIVVLSSHWEGFGLVAAEGMAAGKPVIASDVEGLREVVKGAGELFSKGDSVELGVIINELISDKIKYKKIKEACSERANLFNIETMVADYIKIYGNLYFKNKSNS